MNELTCHINWHSWLSLGGLFSSLICSRVSWNRWLCGKESAGQCKRHKRCRFDPWVRKIPWRRKWQPPPVFLARESHGQRSLAGYSPCGSKESDTNEWPSIHAHAHTHTQNCIYASSLFKILRTCWTGDVIRHFRRVHWGPEMPWLTRGICPVTEPWAGGKGSDSSDPSPSWVSL